MPRNNQLIICVENKNLRNFGTVTRNIKKDNDLANQYIHEADKLLKHIDDLSKSHAKEILMQEPTICRRLKILKSMYIDVHCVGTMLKGRCAG